MNKTTRGPKPKYDFTENEILIDASKLSSFKSLVSRYNSELEKPDKIYFDYSFRPNSSKVTAIKRTS